MNTQVLTLGIVLSFATTACTGLGVQTGPTLASEMFEEQGLANLWSDNTDQAPENTITVEFRDESEIADLWIESEGNSDWNGRTADRTPRATNDMFVRPTLTRSVFGSNADRSEVLLK